MNSSHPGVSNSSHPGVSIRALLMLAVLFGWAAVLRADRVEDLKPTDYVNDFAGVLSQQTITQVDGICSSVYQRANAQIVVVTVKNLDGGDVDDFTARLEEKWKIGRKGSDRGVLILIAVEDHKYRIEVGYGLEGILPDARAGDIGRQMVPSLKKADYDSAVRIATVAVAQIISADAGVDLSQRARPGPSGRQMQQIHLSPFQTIVGGIVLLVVLFLLARSGLLWFLLGMFFGGGWRGGGGYGGGGFDGGGGGFGGGEGGSSGGGGASGSW
jgi:uncharacterized protein